MFVQSFFYQYPRVFKTHLANIQLLGGIIVDCAKRFGNYELIPRVKLPKFCRFYLDEHDFRFCFLGHHDDSVGHFSARSFWSVWSYAYVVALFYRFYGLYQNSCRVSRRGARQGSKTKMLYGSRY